jgi:uncharacterized repeat protein (TIGR04138 family)
MKVHKDFYQVIEEIYQHDNRYKPDAYEFVMHALYFTQEKCKRKGHVQGPELLGGIRQLIIDKYGPMAKTVLQHWGVNSTQDFGNIVFNMVDRKILLKTETDSPGDFKDIFDFEQAFGNVLRDTPLTIE